MHQTVTATAKTTDFQGLRAYVDAQIASAQAKPIDSASGRLALTLTLPHLKLSKKDAALLYRRLSGEVNSILLTLSVHMARMLAFFVLLMPQLILLQRTLRRLPAAINLALNDNLTLEDALGRFHSLQFQQFRHWKVLESSLQCIFAGTPGFLKVSRGYFVLTPEDQPTVTLTEANYSALVRPGYAFKMAIAMRKLTAEATKCPKCAGKVEKVSVLENRCKSCKLQYSNALLGTSRSELGANQSGTSARGNQTGDDRSEGKDASDSASIVRRVQRSSAEDRPLDPLNCALIVWKPPAFDPRVLVEMWEHNREIEEMKFFKRVTVQIRLPALDRASSELSKIDGDLFSPGYYKKFFREEGELGRGSRGVVLLVQHIIDDVDLGLFACKRIPVGDDKAWMQRTFRKIKVLQQLSHQNLVSYRHVWLEDVQVSHFGPSIPCTFVLQQYCNTGSLQDYIRSPINERIRPRSQGRQRAYRSTKARDMPLDVILSFFTDILNGLGHLHQQGYIHRDLKPTNCLLHTAQDGTTRILLGDFGQVQPGDDLDIRTICYHAPELLQSDADATSQAGFTTKSDMWSLGVVLYFMCFGESPFAAGRGFSSDYDYENDDYELLKEEIVSWPGFKGERELALRPHLGAELYVYLDHLLTFEPFRRPECKDIRQEFDTKGRHALSIESHIHQNNANPGTRSDQHPPPLWMTRQQRVAASAWRCCNIDCGETNLRDHNPRRCPVCYHRKCHRCKDVLFKQRRYSRNEDHDPHVNQRVNVNEEERNMQSVRRSMKART
jgi:serine/threonine protein kinase